MLSSFLAFVWGCGVVLWLSCLIVFGLGVIECRCTVYFAGTTGARRCLRRGLCERLLNIRGAVGSLASHTTEGPDTLSLGI